MKKATDNLQPRHLFLLVVLMLTNTVNYMDRSLVFVLGEPIKRDLGLSDSQLGILHGLAFALVFSLLSLPLSRLSDRGLQRLVIMGSVAVWSVMTFLGGLAQSFWKLALMRIGVAAGEAGLHPASHSLISTVLPAEKRGLALAVFSIGMPLGLASGSVLGGWISDEYGWRMAFLIIGPIGLLLLPFIYFSVPKRVHQVQEQDKLDMFAAIGTLLANKAFRYLFIAYAIVTFFGFGMGTFFVPFYMRLHEMTALEGGTIFGFVNAFAGIIGILMGGFIYDLISRRGVAFILIPTIGALLISSVIAPAGWLVSNTSLSITFISIAVFMYIFVSVPTIALAQTFAPTHLRAMASALITISGGLIGATGGPLIAGMLSDMFAPMAGINSVRYALVCISMFQVVGALFYYLVWSALTKELEVRCD